MYRLIRTKLQVRGSSIAQKRLQESVVRRLGLDPLRVKISGFKMPFAFKVFIALLLEVGCHLYNSIHVKEANVKEIESSYPPSGVPSWTNDCKALITVSSTSPSGRDLMNSGMLSNSFSFSSKLAG